MLKRWLIGASALLMLVGVRAQAAAIERLPADAVGKDTTVVVSLNASKCTPDAMREAARAVFAPNDPNLAKINQAIDQFNEKYYKGGLTGVETVTAVGKFDPFTANDPGENGVAYVRLKPGTDSKTLEKWITDSMQPEDRQKAAFDHDAEFMVMHPKGQKLEHAPDAGRAKMMADVLSRNENAAFVIGFVPNAAIQNEAMQHLQQAHGEQWSQDAVSVLANSQWATLAIELGKSPAIVGRVEASDAASATKLSNAITAGLAQLKQKLQDPNQGGGMGPMLMPVVDALKPVQESKAVVVTINGPALSKIASIAGPLVAPLLSGGH